MFLLAAIEHITAGGVVGMCLIVCGWFIVHSKNHPNKADINKQHGDLAESVQYKDVCNERTKRIEEAIGNVDSKVEAGFESLKVLIELKVGK